jgi:DNA helicase II / ATP-dependent DNA helicase PcrA
VQSQPEIRRPELLAGLNDAQIQAVTTVDGPLLVVAGPGSGKTRVLTHRVAYIIEEAGVSPWNILAVTFTNKAAREMRDRLVHLVGEEDAHKLTVGTFHATCVRILRRDGHMIEIDPRFTIYDDGDQMDLIRRVMSAENIDTKRFSPRAVLSRISAAKSRFISPKQFEEQIADYYEEIVSRIYPQYQDTLRRNRALDFDDLLGETLRLFDENPDVLERYQDFYRYTLVDEYQDTNHVQYRLVKALSDGTRNICVVGDPDQSIYGWRQADIRNILDFKRDYPDATEVHLELNYRSTRSIVGAADSIIKANRQRIERDLRTENDAGDKIRIHEAFDETQEASFVVNEIRRLVATGALRYQDCAVMYRTNAQSRALEEAFVRSELPYQIVGGTRFYERKEIKDAMAILRIIANPQDGVSFQRVLNNTALGKGIGARTLELLNGWASLNQRSLYDAIAAAAGQSHLPPPEINNRATNLLYGVHQLVLRLIDQSTQVHLSKLFDIAIEETGFAAQFRETVDPDMMERWENLLQLRGVLTGYDELREEIALETFLEESALVAGQDSMVDDENQVTLITLHAAKGLEFPVVFLIGAEEGILPHSRSIDSENEVEEERRLFYVGVTRAMQKLYVTYAFRRAMFGQSDVAVRSRFIESIPPDLVDMPVQQPSRASRTQSRAPMETDDSGPRSYGRGRPQPEVPPVEIPHLKPGQRVFHNRFGDGTVIDVKDRNGDQDVTVEFKRHGQKRLVASLANLTVD